MSSDESALYTQLRDRANAQLKVGPTPATSHWTLGVDALRLLHRLSSNPESAEDALKLLHELQVHQVELDLQNEEIVANEEALGAGLRRYRALYDCAPFGYFVLAHDGTVIEGNLAAAELFGLAQGELEGHRIDSLLTPEFRPRLRDLLQRVEQSGGKTPCTVQMQPDTSNAAPLQFLASVLPESGHILLACCEGTNVG